MLRTLIPALIVSIALVSPALAEGPGMFHGRGGLGGPPSLMQGEDPMRILQGIKLTPEQETQVHKILEANHASLHDLFDQLRAAQDALATKLLSPGNVSAADVKPLLDQTLQIRQQLAERGLEAMLAVRAVLTPDQLAKAAARRARMKELEAQLRSLLEESN
ncbi:MAG TPA: periplasmic heavy metal sensor [Myxococcota bacterium]|nr:periplasmic heavy metal sensor [Myxococcota bacterium]